jgi:5'-nucleotidase
MQILITNDDGYAATGINVLTQELARVADVSVMAPGLDRSGASNTQTLTLHRGIEPLQQWQNAL